MIYDNITEQRLSKVCPEVSFFWKKVREEFFAQIEKQLRVASGLRTYAEQWADYSKGRLKDKSGEWIICDIKKVVTYARAGESYHNFGLGLDSCFIGPDPWLDQMKKDEAVELWALYGKIVQSVGMTWGGEWPSPKTDRPHCQMTFGLGLHTLQMIYEEGGLTAVYSKVKGLANCGREI